MKFTAWLLSIIAFFSLLAVAVSISVWVGFLTLDTWSPANKENIADNSSKQTGVSPAAVPNQQKSSTEEKTTNSAAAEIETPAIQPQENLPGIEPLEKSGLSPRVILTPPARELEPEPAENQPAENENILTRPGIISKTNLQRQTYLGKDSLLAENSLLDTAAQKKIDDMFANQYFEHISPKGLAAGDFVDGAGYEYIAIGENLAMGDYKNDADLVQAWMDSAGHRENILKPGYREIGVAAGYGMINGRNTWLAVQMFATPKSACPAVDAALSARIDRDRQTLDNFSGEQKTLVSAIDDKEAAALAMKNGIENLIKSGASAAEIQAKQKEFNQAVIAVNEDINGYNAKIKETKLVYDEYKTMVNNYNSQVTAYNACLDALE